MLLRCILVAGLLLLAGCASRPPLLPSLLPGQPGEGAVELADTPFFPQQAYQCGPAALATLLATRGVDVRPEALSPQVYMPGRQGSLQAELVASVRRHDRLPVIIEPTLAALLTAVREGRPVLVLQNLGTDWLPVWHYAVVVGFDTAGDRLLLRSGVERRKWMSAPAFARSWRPADNWGMVLLAPGEPPGGLNRERYLGAVAELEALGRLDAAGRGYAAAAKAWPDWSLAWLATGNLAYRQGRLPEARDAYRRALRLSPGDPVTSNNLAQTLGELGCPQQAAKVLAALPAEHALPTALRKEVARTRHGLSGRGRDGDACGAGAGYR